MLRDRIIQQVGEQLEQLIDGFSPSSSSDKNELQRSVHAIVQNVFEKLELVSREEFDAQKALLESTQQQVAELEAALAELNQPR